MRPWTLRKSADGLQSNQSGIGATGKTSKHNYAPFKGAIMDNLPTHQTGFATLSPQQQEDHRAKIGARAKAILGTFWQEANRDDVVEALEVEGWMDVLQNCSHSEIRAAWADYQKSGPRTARGSLCKPDAGAIYHLILSKRPRPRVVMPAPVAQPEPMTRERYLEVCEELGIQMSEHGGIVGLGAKRMKGATA